MGEKEKRKNGENSSIGRFWKLDSFLPFFMIGFLISCPLISLLTVSLLPLLIEDIGLLVIVSGGAIIVATMVSAFINWAIYVTLAYLIDYLDKRFFKGAHKLS